MGYKSIYFFPLDLALNSFQHPIAAKSRRVRKSQRHSDSSDYEYSRQQETEDSCLYSPSCANGLTRK